MSRKIHFVANRDNVDATADELAVLPRFGSHLDASLQGLANGIRHSYLGNSGCVNISAMQKGRTFTL